MDQLRIGIIGAAGRGTLAKSWHDPKGKSVVVAAADILDGPLQSFQETTNDKAFTTKDHRELLARKDIDAIAVLSPDFTHEDYVCDAFAAGKHVFTEKPMAITTKGCDRMLDAWIKSGKKFMVGFNMRYMNLFRVMKDQIDSGVIGQPKLVWVRHFVGHGGDWYYHDWHGNSKNTTGLLLQKATHDFDMIHWLTGKYTLKTSASGGLDFFGGDKPNDLECPACEIEDDCPESNSPAPTGNPRTQCVFREEVDVEDSSTVMMLLEDEIKATYMQCHYSPDYNRNYTVIGTEGRIEGNTDTEKITVRLRGRSKRWKNLGSHHEIDTSSAAGGHGGADPRICKDFVDMILLGKKPVATLLAGRMSVAVGCAATSSLRNGWRPVDIQPVGDDILQSVY